MTPTVIGAIGIGIVLFLMALEVPIGFAMALVGVLGFSFLVSLQGAMFQAANVPFTLITDYSFCVLPLFMFMAHLIFQAQFSKDLFESANKWLGRLPGGLAIATIGACAVFAAISASSIATAVTIGLVAIPEMKKHGYHRGFCCGAVAAGGTLGILIPPSGILIVYGILTQQSIGKLFIAGIVPGIILSLAFMVVIYFKVLINPTLAPPAARTSLKDKISSLSKTAEIIALVALVLGGLIVGWFTPTEAGAVGAAGALGVALARSRLNWQKFRAAAVDTIEGSGMIFVILIGALICNAFLSVSRLPMALAQLISGLALPKEAILIIITLIYLVLGCLVDAMAMILLTIPIFYPVIVSIGVDPLFFGILTVLVVEMAVITPPIGMNVYAISGIEKETPMMDIFRGAIPFVSVMLAFIFILIFLPEIVLILPRYVG